MSPFARGKIITLFIQALLEARLVLGDLLWIIEACKEETVVLIMQHFISVTEQIAVTNVFYM